MLYPLFTKGFFMSNLILYLFIPDLSSRILPDTSDFASKAIFEKKSMPVGGIWWNAFSNI